MNRIHRNVVVGLITAMLCVGVPANQATAADDLEVQYQATATKILDQLRDAKIRTTGVLKFSVRIGDGAFPGNVGTLNTRLAEKLELALVLANPARRAEEAQQVGIVRGASDVANTIDGATHLTPDGRKQLFSKSYPLAWQHQGKTDVIPDALIVGVAQIRADLSTMTIELMLLSKSDLQLQPITRLTVPTDLEDLMDSGESFTTRGIFDGGSVKETAAKVEAVAKKKAILVKSETLSQSEPQTSTLHPLAASGESPIKFEIWYGNDLQNYEFRDGAAFVREPEEGQEVILAVRRKGSDTKRYGLLVQVNGENTLYRERTPAPKASLWILEPATTEFSIRGFQIDTGEREQFRVLSDADSDKRKFDYGRDIGMISVTVFPENTGTPLPQTDTELDLAIQTQTTLPDETKDSRGELGSSLFDQLIAQSGTRGLIAEGRRTKAAIDTVNFKRDSVPVMATSIRYYKPTE